MKLKNMFKKTRRNDTALRGHDRQPESPRMDCFVSVTSARRLFLRMKYRIMTVSVQSAVIISGYRRISVSR